MTTATYTKLKTGNWGIRVNSESVRDGQTVNVTKKSGESKIETISKVLWRGNGVALCAIGETSRRSNGGYSSHPRTGCSCGSREGIIQASDCWTCKHDA